jgi:uncharacterized protein
MRQAGEPSVEEILDSIKKVIARDNRTDAAELRIQRESAGIPLAVRDETDAEDETGFVEDDVLDLSDNDTEFAEELATAIEPDGPLISENTRSSMQDSLAALAMISEPGVRPQIVRSGETSLESLTRELLRPALAEWLEENLPPLVERLVAAEIERIVGKRG